jgi:hypothetical protein
LIDVGADERELGANAGDRVGSERQAQVGRTGSNGGNGVKDGAGGLCRIARPDRARILEAAPGPIDVVLDLMPPAASAAQVRSALLSVRPFGRVVLMGGVREELSLPYAWLMRNCVRVCGRFMYSRLDWAPGRLGARRRAAARCLTGRVFRLGAGERGRSARKPTRRTLRGHRDLSVGPEA